MQVVVGALGHLSGLASSPAADGSERYMPTTPRVPVCLLREELVVQVLGQVQQGCSGDGGSVKLAELARRLCHERIAKPVPHV